MSETALNNKTLLVVGAENPISCLCPGEKYNRSQKEPHSTLLEFNIGTRGINYRQYCSVPVQQNQEHNFRLIPLLSLKLPFVRSDEVILREQER